MTRATRTSARDKTAPPPTGMTLHTREGARQYLTTGERAAFLKAAERADREDRTLLLAAVIRAQGPVRRAGGLYEYLTIATRLRRPAMP